MKLSEVLEKTIQFFKQKEIETARLDAELLLVKALNLKSRVDLYLKFEQPLSESEIEKCREYVRRRSQGEPVAYILEQKEFYGLQFYVNKSVLIPRPETELIVERALKWCSENEMSRPRILDLGTGSGCIIVSLLKKLNLASGVAVDKSSDALEVAEKNRSIHELSDRLDLVLGEAENIQILMNDKQRFDIVVSNPPYISIDDQNIESNVKKYEPGQALFAAENGFSSLKNWSQAALSILKPKGMILFELGFQQGPEMLDYFEKKLKLDKNELLKDYSGHDRMIYGEKNG